MTRRDAGAARAELQGWTPDQLRAYWAAKTQELRIRQARLREQRDQAQVAGRE